LRIGVAVDVVNWREDFAKHKLVIAPMLYLIDDDMAATLRNYAGASGG